MTQHPAEKTRTIKFCQFCEGTGIIKNPDAYITGENPITPCPKCVLPHCKCGGESPYLYIKEGKVAECPCNPVRYRINKITHLFAQSDIDKKFRWLFLNDFNVKTQTDNRVKSAAYKIIHNFPDVTKGLFLWGNPGTGKTMISAIILTELISRYAISGKFLKISRNFFGKLRSTFVEGSSLYGMSSQIERDLATLDVLIVDDFGVQRDSPWEQETLYNLVDSRYDAEKFTIFTSNNNPVESMKEMGGGRILSRIKEMCYIMELSGVDHRDEK
ncbi:MAG: ATP-binding protein [Spirochaetes bacterium]|nr:ATP-binding protein [Spirochaetota bacterium]